MTTATNKPILLDNGIVITADEQLARVDNDKKEVLPCGPSAVGMTRSTSNCPEQVTSYGRIEFFETPAKNIVAHMIYERGEDGNPLATKMHRWVPMTGKKADEPRRKKIVQSFRDGETMFDPNQFKAR